MNLLLAEWIEMALVLLEGVVGALAEIAWARETLVDVGSMWTALPVASDQEVHPEQSVVKVQCVSLAEVLSGMTV